MMKFAYATDGGSFQLCDKGLPDLTEPVRRDEVPVPQIETASRVVAWMDWNTTVSSTATMSRRAWRHEFQFRLVKITKFIFTIITRTPRVVAAIAMMAIASNAYCEVGVNDSTVTIGMSSPFSGQNGAYGRQMREGILACFDGVNKSGGVHGRQLVLMSYDDGYEVERAVANTQRLIETDRVFALLGYYGSASTTSAMEVFSRERVPLIGAVSGALSLRQPVNRYMFNVRASYAEEAKAIIDQVLLQGQSRIAVLYQNDSFGLSGLDGIRTALKQRGSAPIEVASIERNSVDVKEAVNQISAARPQVVILVTLYRATAEFIQQYRGIQKGTSFIALSPVGADLLVEELGELSARGIGTSQVMPYPWTSSLSIAREFRAALAKRPRPIEPSYYALEGYIAARVAVEGIRRAGKQLTREGLVSTLESFRAVDFGGYFITYSNQNHDGSHFVDLTIVGEGGKILR